MMEPQTDNGTFEATRTILAPMPVLGIPEVLVDEARGLWSVRAAGAEQPSIYRCSDIRSCEVFEVEPALSAPKNASGVTDWYRSSS